MQSNNTTHGSIMEAGGVPANQGVVLHWEYGTLVAYFFIGHTLWVLDDGGYLKQGGWRHVVVTWCQYYGVKLYINGGLVAATTATAILYLVLNDAPHFLLGADVDAISNAELNTFVGTLDEFRVWDMVMSDEEVWGLYTADSQLV